MSQRFVRCAHCGLPHALEESLCPITGRPIEARRSARAPAPPDARRAVEPPEVRRALEAPARPRVEPTRAEEPQRQRPSTQPPPFSDSVAPPPLLGQLLGGKYRALRVLGEGGMGAVYECEHIQLHRKVAVKVLHPAQARKKASVQRFQNEAHVAGAIGHPNICEIYDMGELEDGSPFLVMELLQGETLADRIASEGALPFDDIVDVISQVLSGLVAAHEKGIIHRDIKPENVFLTTRPGLPPMVKLLDFGISKVAGADDLHLTRTGMVMGTPFYMSPEQARGDRNLDHRVDLYATGVMLYECLTGRRPFHAANYNALLMQILTTSPRPPHEVRPAVPDAFEACVARAMQRDREKRYANAAEMQRDVALLRDPGAMRRVPSVPPEPVPLVTQRRRSDGPQRRRGEDAPPPPRPVELPAVSIDLEGRDLLDSGLLRDASGLEEADSGSIEIPIVAEPPVSREAAREPLPASTRRPDPTSRRPDEGRLYRPDPALVASRTSSPPPPRSPKPSVPPPIPGAAARVAQRAPSIAAPRPTSQATVSRARPPAMPPRPMSPPPPSPGSNPLPPSVSAAPPKASEPEARPARAGRSPAVPPRTEVQAPPPSRPARDRAPAATPTALDNALANAHASAHDGAHDSAHDVDAPWLDDSSDPDPTEIGSIFAHLQRPLSELPIDADSTERIPPERLARLGKLPRVREVHAPSPRDPRVEDATPAPPREEPSNAERLADDDAPTTLFDRRALKGKGLSKKTTGSNAAARSAPTTERAPAPTPSLGRPPSIAPMQQPPLPRLRGPKDR